MKSRFFLFVLICMFLFVFVSSVKNPTDSLVQKQGISLDSVVNVSSVNKTVLPSGISISSVEDSNVEIQQVEYDDFGVLKKVFVISFTEQGLKQVIQQKAFESETLLSFSGVQNLGSYVMLKSGSITGLSSFVEYSGSGEIVVEVYRNNELMFISNNILSTGTNFDFDLQSSGLDLFYPGDVISLRVRSVGDISVEEVNSIVKIN